MNEDKLLLGPASLALLRKSTLTPALSHEVEGEIQGGSMNMAEVIETARSRRAQVAALLPKRFFYRWNNLLHVYDIVFKPDEGTAFEPDDETGSCIVFALGVTGERDAKKVCELLNHCGYVPQALQQKVIGHDPRDQTP